MNKSLLIGAALECAAAMTPVAALAQQLPPAVIAIVDRERIAGSCTQCVAAAQQIQAQNRAYQAREQQLLAPLQAEGNAIQAALNAAGGNADAALQARIQTFRTNSEAADRELSQAQVTLRRNQQFLVNQMLERMGPLIGQVMRERGANVALDVGQSVAHAPALNITDQVLALMNANAAPFNVIAPPPQQAQRPAQAPAAQQRPPAQQPQQNRPRPQGR